MESQDSIGDDQESESSDRVASSAVTAAPKHLNEATQNVIGRVCDCDKEGLGKTLREARLRRRLISPKHNHPVLPAEAKPIG